MVQININGRDVEVEDGVTVLNAAKKFGIRIPTLCYSPDLPAWGSCGLCIVRVFFGKSPRSKMLRSCCTTCSNGMRIITDDPEIRRARRTVLELILSNHPDDCLRCDKNQHCELQKLAWEFGIRENPFSKVLGDKPVDDSYPEIVLDRQKCISCGRCVTTCQIVQNVWALEYNGRGDKTVIGPVADVDMAHSPCIRCGQCEAHCPVGAITIKHPLHTLLDKLNDEKLVTVASIAPSVRAALGEEFGMEPGTITTGKIYTALRALGFKYVFDTNFGADLTIMEEGSELLERVTKGGKLPMFTSCCPGWVDYAEKNYHDLLDNLSTAKSPQQMEGAMVKTYFAEKIGAKPENIYNVSIMPCTAKAWESQRNDTMKSSGVQDYDEVLTTREFAHLIKMAGIDFAALDDGTADSILGEYTGAGTIFGATGGVMEAAIRTAYYLVNKKEMAPIEFKPIRGLQDVRTAEVDLAGTKLRIAAVSQMGNVDALVQEVRKALAEGKEPPYHFIEVMACRGGCIAGGGQPFGATDDLRKKRAAALYTDDVNSAERQSHNNPEIKKIYADFLGKPLGEKSHKYLHTHYTERELYR
ncbi:MAG: [FeFe] hydrogenase, group A [Treponema sp.]|jgi:NADH-quinone oxidoreductase subunit G|nr:[FeFe] hydrogenase, group A [Treponema sp.]